MNNNNIWESFISLGLLTMVVLLILFPDFAFAGTGGEELQTIHDKTVGMIQGWGGKTLAAASFAWGVIRAINGGLTSFITPAALGIIIGVGPTVVTSGISALI